MESFSTEKLRSAGKTEAWNRIYSGLLAAADFIPSGKEFSAGLQLSHVGCLGLARLATGPCTIRRTTAHIDRSSPQLYSILVQAHGRGLFTQGGQRAVLNPGDFALCDHALPHSRRLEADAETLIIRVPAEIIGHYLPQAEALCGHRLPASAGLTPSAGAMIRSLWNRLEQGIASDYEDCLAHHMLEIIATSYAMVFGVRLPCESVASREMLTVQNHVEGRLHDPDFKPCAIADELAMSQRDVRRLFAARGESARAYVSRRRLEEAARRLRDPRWRGHTVAEIAHCCGFVSTALFARSFRDHHGMTPTDYRESGGRPN
jgi:AraC-like DNA-binding protein